MQKSGKDTQKAEKGLKKSGKAMQKSGQEQEVKKEMLKMEERLAFGRAKADGRAKTAKVCVKTLATGAAVCSLSLPPAACAALVPPARLLVTAAASRICIAPLDTAASGAKTSTFSAPEHISALACTPSLLLAGSVSGRVFVWKIHSGELLAMYSAHFKEISTVAFVDNGSAILTASHDSLIHIFAWADLLGSRDSPQPIHTISQHALPVTGAAVSRLGDRVYSVSKDATLCISSTRHRSARRIAFPRMLTCVALSTLESVVWVGDVSGDIYQHPCGCAATTGTFDGLCSSTRMAQHQGPITAIQESFTGERIVSAAMDGSVVVWDAASLQALYVLDESAGGGVPWLVLYMDMPHGPNAADLVPMPEVAFNRFLGDAGSSVVMPMVSQDRTDVCIATDATTTTTTTSSSSGKDVSEEARAARVLYAALCKTILSEE